MFEKNYKMRNYLISYLLRRRIMFTEIDAPYTLHYYFNSVSDAIKAIRYIYNFDRVLYYDMESCENKKSFESRIWIDRDPYTDEIKKIYIALGRK